MFNWTPAFNFLLIVALFFIMIVVMVGNIVVGFLIGLPFGPIITMGLLIFEIFILIAFTSEAEL